jgi:hypothetical protein
MLIGYFVEVFVHAPSYQDAAVYTSTINLIPSCVQPCMLLKPQLRGITCEPNQFHLEKSGTTIAWRRTEHNALQPQWLGCKLNAGPLLHIILKKG